MTETYWQILTETLSPDIREIIGKHLLDLLKTADQGQAVIETKQHSIHGFFVGHSVIISKLNGNGETACRN